MYSEREEVTYDPMFEAGDRNWMEDQEEDLSEEENSDFVVVDDSSADWCVRKIAECEANIQKWEAHFANQLAKIKEANERDIEFFKAKLFAYFNTVPHKAAKASESYPLPSGKLVIKKQSPDYQREDDKVIEWLKKNKMPQFVKTVETLDWAGLKKKVAVVGTDVVTEDGEIIPGIVAVARPDVFKVEVK